MGDFFTRLGSKTSEFWLVFIALVLPYADKLMSNLTAAGEPLDASVHIGGALLAGAYAGARAWVKGKAAQPSPAPAVEAPGAKTAAFPAAAPGRF